MPTVQPLWKMIWDNLCKLNTHTPYGLGHRPNRSVPICSPKDVYRKVNNSTMLIAPNSLVPPAQ